MAKSLPSPTPDDPLNMAGAEWAARVEWAKGQIADACYVPAMPPKPWAGRDDMLAAFCEKFGGTLKDAAGYIDAAVMDLCGSEREDPTPALKRTMLLRLIGIRKLVLKAINEGRMETTYKTEEHPEGSGKFRKVPFKEKKYHGIDMAAIGRLLELERNIAELQGLKGPEEGSGTLSILEELDGVLDGTQKRKIQVSLAQKIKTGQIDKLTPEGQKMLEAALGEKSKQVESKVVEAEDGHAGGSISDEDDEEGEGEDE